MAEVEPFASVTLHPTALTVGSPVFGAPPLQRIIAQGSFAVGSPSIGAPALKAISNLGAFLPAWSPVIDAPSLGQVHGLIAAPLTISRVFVGTPGRDRMLTTDLVVGSPDIPAGDFHTAWGPWTPLPTQSQQVSEAVALLDRVLDGLLKTVPGAVTGRPAWDFRRAVGTIRANEADLIVNGTLGAAALNAWTLAARCSATFDTFETLNKAVTAETPQYLPAIAVATLAIELTLSQMAQATAATTFVSRDDALSALNRIAAAFAPAEEAVSDDADPMSYRLLVALRAAAVRDLAQRGRQLPRVVPYSFPTAMPTLWIANRIYGDGSRSEDLIAENKIVHPGFAPPDGVCLSQ
jgi:hypothetical protein